MDHAIQQIRLPQGGRRQLLIRAWEAAVEGATEDDIITLDEENALARYPDHFGITTHEVNVNGAHTSLIQAAVIRDLTPGIISQRQNIEGTGYPST